MFTRSSRRGQSHRQVAASEGEEEEENSSCTCSSVLAIWASEVINGKDAGERERERVGGVEGGGASGDICTLSRRFHFLDVTFFQMLGGLEVPPTPPNGPWLRPPGSAHLADRR